MLAHDYVEMPSKGREIGDDPHETVMLLRCGWCFKTPMKAREDGCPVRTLETLGTIPLSEYNPEGVKYFEGRNCTTCDRPIMGHELRRGYNLYWCSPNMNQFSDGITDCIWDVEGVKVPEEPKIKLLGGTSDTHSPL